MMTALKTALRYAARWPIFPCDADKRPLVARGFHDASAAAAQITEWWQRWPEALIGLPTGEPIGVAVLDIDVKQPEANGYDTLDDLGFGVLPDTPIVHTRSGGLHLYFQCPEGGLRNTAGQRGRGVGPGLDWRGTGGYVILPSPGSGYEWDAHWNFKTCSPVPVPAGLLPREPERAAPAAPIRPVVGLSPYAKSALDSACKRIMGAPCGEQENTLNAEAFAIGTLAGAGGIPADFALKALVWAASQMPSYDGRRPWIASETNRKVQRAFHEGTRHPRSAA